MPTKLYTNDFNYTENLKIKMYPFHSSLFLLFLLIISYTLVYVSDELVDDCYLIESLNHSYLPGINQLIRYKNSTSLGANFLPAELINLIPFLLPLKIIQLAHVCIISSKLIKNWS